MTYKEFKHKVKQYVDNAKLDARKIRYQNEGGIYKARHGGILIIGSNNTDKVKVVWGNRSRGGCVTSNGGMHSAII